MPDIAIVGGGAAGLAAAFSALEHGAKVTLFEPNGVLGKKLCITGKGRGNVTNHTDPKSFLTQVLRGGKFLYSALYSFTPEDTENWLESLGVPLKTERGNRVFPVSDRACDVRDAIENSLKRSPRFTRIRAKVREIRAIAGGLQVFCEDSDKASVFDRVILACGGKSYPKTGSTGDGYRLAQSFGHRITPCSPSLTPILCRESFCGKLEGLSLKNVRLSLKNETGKGAEFSELGELLFTDSGISGPLALRASAYLSGGRFPRTLELDLKPALSEEELDRRFLRDFKESTNRDFKHALDRLLPASFRAVMVAFSGIDPAQKVHQITKAERRRLVGLFKHLTLTAEDLGGFDEAIVTRGGVDLEEVDPHTMESKLQKNLYFAGEMLDLDAFTGGYNLQIAFSTGMLAGAKCTLTDQN